MQLLNTPVDSRIQYTSMTTSMPESTGPTLPVPNQFPPLRLPGYAPPCMMRLPHNNFSSEGFCGGGSSLPDALT